ncbi:beta-ketoacyl-[acyl-carrier-protein] synthase family protein [Cohnella kolymensis]|uniref:hypothetical protein n=1 Tax=Cohnella kolymensis TaxID=1590652 RepID=UPI000697C4B6|nr:hypothetical protein [Cohnella kolymensis]
MKARFDNISIKGIAAGIPRESLDLDSLGELFGEEEVKRIIASTGIAKVRVAGTDQCTSDLCAAAAKRLLTELDVGPWTIDGIVFVSQTPDYILPSTSSLLQHRLGLPITAVAFDMHHGCSGYVYGLYQAA